ncbi:hypothetical protein LXL04_016833 [Taraxacum kok-saghyz]
MFFDYLLCNSYLLRCCTNSLLSYILGTMESSGGFSFNDMNQTMRKKRSDRRPRNDVPQENNNNLSLSSSPPSNNGSKGPSDDNGGQRKILNLNQCNSRASYTNSELETQASSDDKDTGADTTEVFASNYKDTKYDNSNNTPTSDGNNSGLLDADSDAKGVDNVVKKVKLKVGGVIRTIHAKPSSLKPPHGSKQKQNSMENPDPQDLASSLRGIPWKDFSRSGFAVGKTSSSKRTIPEETISKNHNSANKRVSKKRVLDNEDDDAELRYLMKLKSTKVDDEEEGGSKKHRKMSSVLKMESFGSSKVEKDRKKLKTGKESEDNDYTGEERVSPGEDSGREMMTVTTRRKAMKSGRDVSGESTASVVEFPHGLPPAPPRKQKEKLSEVEHQLKKAEAAQRRKIQAAKAARESEAEAIRKILGQDSSRKKREMKQKQRQEELHQERTTNAATLSSNTVRLMIRPTGTVVTFSDDIGLPNLFETRTSSYPPPREKCAGPLCSNPFKYRDSKSKLPLCSLQCYKAVQEKTHTGAVY